MIELIGGKAGLSCGRFHYGSAFGEPSGNADKVEDIRYTSVSLTPQVCLIVLILTLFFLSYQQYSNHAWLQLYNRKDFLYSGAF